MIFSELNVEDSINFPIEEFYDTLESLIIVPLVIKVPQSNGGVKIVLIDFLTAMSLS